MKCSQEGTRRSDQTWRKRLIFSGGSRIVLIYTETLTTFLIRTFFCPYQKDLLAKPGNLPTSSAFSENEVPPPSRVTRNCISMMSTSFGIMTIKYFFVFNWISKLSCVDASCLLGNIWHFLSSMRSKIDWETFISVRIWQLSSSWRSKWSHCCCN